MIKFEETKTSVFFCTENGRIYVKNKLTSEIKEAKTRPNNRGYLVVYANGPKFVHRIVASIFVEGDVSLQVNHKDGVKTNNNALNLEWVTCSENLKHAVKLKLNPQAGSTHTKARLNEEIVSDLRTSWDQTSASIEFYAKEYDVCANTMRLALTGKTWKELENPGKKLIKLDSPANKVLDKTCLEEIRSSWTGNPAQLEQKASDLGITFAYLCGQVRKTYPDLFLQKRTRKSKLCNKVLESAFEEIRSGQAIAAVARKFNIQRKTLSVFYNRQLAHSV